MAAHLISGGVRSGKSAHAEALAKRLGLPTIYVATAEILDDEMKQRVERHRAARPSSWRTVEAGMDLADVVRREDERGVCIILDCLTLWLTRFLPDEKKPGLEAARSALIAAVAGSAAEMLIVTNELGCGVTPIGRVSRLFIDEHGIVNQRIAAVCDRVTLMVCGCPVTVKPGASHPAS